MTKRWHVSAVSGLWVSGLALVLLGGCNQHPLQELDETVTAVNRQENRLPAKTKIDFLFVIDNSGSMCEEQANLTRNFGLFSNFLFEELGASADYRIAVTSTDMNPDSGDRGRFLNTPALPVPSLNCIDENGDPNVPDTADCQELVMNGELDPVIKSGAEGNIGRNCNAADPADQAQCAKEDLERKFRCLATLGTQGDGFEKGLEALRVALSCEGPNAPTYNNEGVITDPGMFGACCVPVDERGRRTLRYNPACELGPNDAEPEFLRPDAVLVVIIVSDEDDCSDPATNPAASRRAICKYATTDEDGNGIPDGFNDPDLCSNNRTPAECYAAECGMLTPDECRQQRCEIPRTENNSCEWFRSDLTPVQDYYRFLTSLKARPLEQLVVATIVGQRDYTAPSAFEITYNRGQTNGACLMDDGEGGDVAVTTDMCCPNGRCVGEIATSCESENGEAFAGRRYLQLAETFNENGIGCPPPPAGLPADAQRVVACANSARDAECEYLDEVEETVTGKCRPVEGDGTLVCTECVTICEDNFARPLGAIKEKVAQIVATYCLDKPPACQINTENGTRPCESVEEFDNPANYPIRVRQQCLLTEDQGGLCQDLLPPTVLATSDWSLRLNQAGCDGGALVQLNEPPPAGAEVFVEFLVEVGDGPRRPAGAVDGGVPAPDAAP